jgi:hypothetical protein
LNACPCLLTQLVPKDYVQRDYGIFDSDCLTAWDSIYLPPQSEFFRHVSFYLASDCEKLALKQLGFLEYSELSAKREYDIQFYRKQRHDWFQSQLHELGLSYYQLNESDGAYVRSSISSFLHQNDLPTFKEEWDIYSNLLNIKQELQKKRRKDNLLMTMENMGYHVELLTRCGEEFVETGIISDCCEKPTCKKECSFLASISPDLIINLQWKEKGGDLSKLSHHIAQHHANAKGLEDIIESIILRNMSGNLYSMDVLVRWIKQVLRKQANESVTLPVLNSIAQLVCKKYLLSKQVKEQQDKDFSLRMFHFLESSIASKCPLISKKLLPLSNQMHDPLVKAIVDQFCSLKHRYCSKHMTVCLEYAVSDLASHYRQKESHRYLKKELVKFMPFFNSKDDLSSPGSQERFESSTRLGMWMHIPLNAFRIYREECLYNNLIQSVNGFAYSSLLERAKQSYRQFILSDSHLPSQSNSLEWPKNGEMVLVIAEIVKNEQFKNTKIILGNSVLTCLKLDLDTDMKLQFQVP